MWICNKQDQRLKRKNAEKLLFIPLLCESTVYFTPLWVYCLFHPSVSLLFIPLLCESTVYSTLLRVYCLFHSSVSLLFMPLSSVTSVSLHPSVSPLFIQHTVSAVYSIILCGWCESTVYSTPLWAYCLFHSSVSQLFISLLHRSTVYSTPLWVYCLFHSCLLFIPLLSTVYSTPMWAYCLFHSYVSLLFIPLLCESTVYSTPVYCLFHSYVSHCEPTVSSTPVGLLFLPLLCKSTVYSTPM